MDCHVARLRMMNRVKSVLLAHPPASNILLGIRASLPFVNGLYFRQNLGPSFISHESLCYSHRFELPGS